MIRVHLSAAVQEQGCEVKAPVCEHISSPSYAYPFLKLNIQFIIWQTMAIIKTKSYQIMREILVWVITDQVKLTMTS